MMNWLDRHFVDGWKETWGDYSTAFMALLSSVVSFLATNSAELVGLLGFVPSGPIQGLIGLVIFASLMLAGMVSKWVKQKEDVPTLSAAGRTVYKGRKTAAGAGLFAIAALIMSQFTPVWEGRRLTPYQDAVGVWTVCEGETRVPMRNADGSLKVRSHAECDEMSREMYEEFLGHVASTSSGIEHWPWMHAAMADTAINIGKAGYDRSSMALEYRRGNYRQACRAILKYKYAGGRVFRGLLLRRTGDASRIGAYEVCLGDAVEAELAAKGVL